MLDKYSKILMRLPCNLEPSKVMRFWAACQLGKGDYLKLKEQIFEGENVSSLYEQITAYQDIRQENNDE